MATNKHLSKKIRLIKHGKQTVWAPFWTIPKIYGKGKMGSVHPMRHTSVKRNWRRTRTKA
ncbi:MAG: hypothetical protein ACMXYC_03995 [Candidatus Woesearchaeota archaeon]